jgi:Putative metallopeptidase
VPAAGVGHGATQPGRFKVVYVQPRTADEKLLVGLIKASRLNDVAAGLSKSLVIPRDVTIAVTRGPDGPFFDPRTKTMVFNLPFPALTFRVITNEYPKIIPYNFGVAFASLQYFILFHEIGHSLINLWHIPVLGREEDAVDAFSTIFMTDVVKDGRVALWGADFFNAVSSGEKYGPVAFADEHSLSPQRAYSIACWVYGSNPTAFGYLARIVPHERLTRCPGDTDSCARRGSTSSGRTCGRKSAAAPAPPAVVEPERHVQRGVDEPDDQRPPDRVLEARDVERPDDPRRQVEHEQVDEEEGDAEREHDQRQREQLHDRLQDDVDRPEHEPGEDQHPELVRVVDPVDEDGGDEDRRDVEDPGLDEPAQHRPRVYVVSSTRSCSPRTCDVTTQPSYSPKS